MSRILIVLQAGAAGRAAIGAGLDLAEALSWQILFFHAAFQPVVPLICDAPGLLDDAAAHCRQDEERRVEASLASASSDSWARGVDCETAVAWGGDPVEHISRAAAARGCELIVVGAIRQGAIARLLNGSLASALVARAFKPVLVVGADERASDVVPARPVAAARIRPSCSRAPTVEPRR